MSRRHPGRGLRRRSRRSTPRHQALPRSSRRFGAFYAALDDEQKARLLRDLTLSRPQAREGDRTAERSERRSRGRGASGATRGREANLWAGICEHLTAALRGWPIREIERGVRLSEMQRVAFYELVTSSLKAADTLAGACPAETTLTPPGRMTRCARVFQSCVRRQPRSVPRSCSSTRRWTRDRRSDLRGCTDAVRRRTQPARSLRRGVS